MISGTVIDNLTVNSTISMRYSNQQLIKFILYVFVVLRILTLVFHWPAFVGGDSISYRSLNPQPEELSYFKYWPETLWGGSFRSIFPVLFFHILPTDNIRFLGQSILFTISYFLFLNYMYKYLNTFLKSDYIKFSIIILLTTIGLSPQVVSFEKLIYSESTTLSLLFLLIVLFFKVKVDSKLNPKTFIFMNLLIFLIVTAKPNLILVAFFSYLFILKELLEFRTIIRYFFVSFIFVNLLLTTFYLNLQNKTWSQTINRQMTTISYYLSQDNINAASFIKVFNDSNKPECLVDIEVPFESGKQMFWGIDLNRSQTCPAGQLWITKNWLNLIFEWQWLYPLEAVNTYRTAVISSARFAQYFGTTSPVPMVLNSLVFPTVDSTVAFWESYNTSGPSREPRNNYEPVYFYLAIILVLFVVNVKPGLSFISKSTTVKIALLFTLEFLSLFANIFLIVGPPGEVYRMSFIPWLMIRITSLVVLAFIIDAYFQKRKMINNAN